MVKCAQSDPGQWLKKTINTENHPPPMYAKAVFNESNISAVNGWDPIFAVVNFTKAAKNAKLIVQTF